MEELYKEEKLTRDILRVAALESPSTSFAATVMKKTTATARVIETRPLVSIRGWVLLFGIFTLSSMLLYFYPLTETPVTDNFELLSEHFNEVVSHFYISKESWYAFVFLSLFLVQIPFLKRFLDKQRT